MKEEGPCADLRSGVCFARAGSRARSRTRRRPSVAAGVMFACLFAGPLRAQSSTDLDFLAGLPDFTRVRSMLPDYLNHIAMALLEERRRAVGQWSSADDVRRRKAYLRERMVRALGGFPERTPLNARTVGVLERDGYKIEKIVFESQPRFYVTANLYLPTAGQPPFPGVLFPLGHERGGKSNPTWQQILATLPERLRGNDLGSRGPGRAGATVRC